MTHYNNKLVAIILAGGLSRRMSGEDKGLQTINGKALIDYVITAIKPQVDNIVISANRNIEEYGQRGYPVIIDDFGEFEGPLAGILTVMQTLPEDNLLLVVPCDMPVLPTNLVEQLMQQLYLENAELCCAELQHRLQPLISVIKTSTRDSLLNFLVGGKHKVLDWIHQLHYTSISIDDPAVININTPEDLNAFKKYLAD